MIKKTRWETKGISVQRITLLGMFLSFLFISKYMFGFIAGFETTTFLFIMAALILPTKDSFILVVGFNLLNLVFYGFGTWWLVYWFIWPTDIIITKVISKFTKNKFAIATTGFFLGMSVIFWYFMSDLIVLGGVYALANSITALPINLMGGIGAFVLIITLADPMLKISQQYSGSLWGTEGYRLSPVKNMTLNLTISGGVSAIGIASIATLIVHNSFFLDWREGFVQEIDVEYSYDALIPEEEFLHYQETLTDTQVAIAVIDDDDYWVDILTYVPGASLFDMMNLDVDGRYDDDTIFTFQAKEFPPIGWFIQGFMVDDVHDEWMHDQGATAMYTWDKPNAGSGITTSPATLYQLSYNVYN